MLYLTWKRGCGEWGTSTVKPSNYTHDSWGPFDNVFDLKQKEHELRGLSEKERIELAKQEAGLELAHMM